MNYREHAIIRELATLDCGLVYGFDKHTLTASVSKEGVTFFIEQSGIDLLDTSFEHWQVDGKALKVSDVYKLWNTLEMVTIS